MFCLSHRRLGGGLALLTGFALLTALIASFSSPSLAAGPKHPIEGIWFDSKGDGAVRLSLCGSKLCGRIFWIKKPLQKNGEPLVDGNNPSRIKRKRPICGLPIVGGLTRQRPGKWVEGWIYDPKVGKQYNVQLTLASKDVLKVRGYLAILALGQTRTWKRAPDTLPKCTSSKQRDVKTKKRGNAG